MMKFIDSNYINAGISSFENPTLPFIEKELNLDTLLIDNPSATKILASPNKLLSRGIDEGDWLIVNASLTPRPKDVVYAECNGIHAAVSFEHLKQHYSDNEDLKLIGVIQQSVHFYRKTQIIPDHECMRDMSFHHALVDQEFSTVLAKTSGDSMNPFTHSEDLVLIERHLTPVDMDVCVLALDGQLTMKRTHFSNRIFLSDNPKYRPRRFEEFSVMKIEGIINKVLRLHRCL